MKPITKTDAEFLSDRFYDFHDKVWVVVKQMIRIQNEVEGASKDEDLSLNYYCIARHNKNIVVASYHNAQNHEAKIQFPLTYLYDDNWGEKYKDELVKETEEVTSMREKYQKERDLNEIKRLKKLYPQLFKD